MYYTNYSLIYCRCRQYNCTCYYVWTYIDQDFKYPSLRTETQSPLNLLVLVSTYVQHVCYIEQNPTPNLPPPPPPPPPPPLSPPFPPPFPPILPSPSKLFLFLSLYFFTIFFSHFFFFCVISFASVLFFYYFFYI